MAQQLYKSALNKLQNLTDGDWIAAFSNNGTIAERIVISDFIDVLGLSKAEDVKNFASHDLIFTANRSHNLKDKDLILNNANSIYHRVGLETGATQEVTSVMTDSRFLTTFTSTTTNVTSLINIGGGDATLSYIAPGYSQEIQSGSSGNIISSSRAETAALKINSTVGGFLMPTVTTVQRDAMSAANGWAVYNTTTSEFNYYNGTSWNPIGADTNFATTDLTLDANRTHDLAGFNALLDNGFVGINTNGATTPNTRLQVFIDSDSERGIRLNNLATNSQFSMWTRQITGTNAFVLDSDNSGNTVLTIDENQNMGVGISTSTLPQSKLHVKGSGITSTTTTLLAENGNGDNIFEISDDSVSKFSGPTTITPTDVLTFFDRTNVSTYGAIGTDNGATYFNVAGSHDELDFRVNQLSSLKINTDRTINVSTLGAGANVDVLGRDVNGDIVPATTFNGTFVGDGSGLTGLPASPDTNMATDDLTLTADRDHNLDGNKLTLKTSSPATGYFGIRNSETASGVECLKIWSEISPRYTYINNIQNSLFLGGSGDLDQLELANGYAKYKTRVSIIPDGPVGDAYLQVRGGTGAGATTKVFLVEDNLGGEAFRITNDKQTYTKRLNITGLGGTSATTALLVENSLTTQLFKIDDDGGFALGNSAVYGSRDNVSIGERASATATGSIAIGEDATSNSLYGVAIGGLANTGGGYNVAIGHGATNSSSGSAIGYQASTSGGSSLAVGSNATSGPSGVAVGKSATNTQYGVAIGHNATTSANAGGLAVGNGTTCSTSTSMIFSARAYGAAATNSTSKTVEFYLSATSVFRFGETVDGWLNSTGNFVFGNNTVAGSAKLAVDSTTSGFLPPRMTTTEKNAIIAPASGLMVYDTTLNKLCVYTVAAWETITSA